MMQVHGHVGFNNYRQFCWWHQARTEESEGIYALVLAEPSLKTTPPIFPVGQQEIHHVDAGLRYYWVTFGAENEFRRLNSTSNAHTT